ncbi:MAG: hypothetical protein RMJ07_02430 [Nitrososphaerota archaeon]|nr:hypothetical protein [Candidatus Bathyarchaeota archaeon]MDW8048525.1 hypothetical protein [Nitrososphaerota archaeon]
MLIATSVAEEGLGILIDYGVFKSLFKRDTLYTTQRQNRQTCSWKSNNTNSRGTVDEAFYWSSISRARKMKRIISQLNRKMPELLKEKAKPAITLMDYQPQTKQAPISTQMLHTEAAMPRK